MLGQEFAPRADRAGAVVEGIDGGCEHHFRADGVKREFEADDDPDIAAPALSAQRRSGFSSSLARTSTPSAVTSSAAIRLSAESPCLARSHPIPPVRVTPP